MLLKLFFPCPASCLSFYCRFKEIGGIVRWRTEKNCKKQQPLSFSALFPKSLKRAVKELLFSHPKRSSCCSLCRVWRLVGSRVLLSHCTGQHIPPQAPWHGGKGGRLAREPGNRVPRAGKRKQENYQDRQSGGGWMRIQTVAAKTRRWSRTLYLTELLSWMLLESSSFEGSQN